MGRKVYSGMAKVSEEYSQKAGCHGLRGSLKTEYKKNP